ncbi:ATP synthase F0 subunit B [Candidatus Poribacteria bacterium]|nr:MAG: ATP synthase F0 subunit B [Candidatus Poribacteria bacterium]
MEGLMEQLGINVKGIIIQAIGFLIMILILWKFAFNRVMHLLDARRERIEEQLREIREGREENERLRAELENRLRQVEAEAERRMREMLSQAEEERERILARAREEAAEEFRRAREEIERERRRALADLKATVSELAVMIAEKIMEMSLDEEKHREIIDRIIDQLTPSLIRGSAERAVER